MDKDEIRLARRLMGNYNIGSLTDLDDSDTDILFCMLRDEIDLRRGTKTHTELMEGLVDEYPGLKKVHGENIDLYLQPV